jgi:hypothetical protein
MGFGVLISVKDSIDAGKRRFACGTIRIENAQTDPSNICSSEFYTRVATTPRLSRTQD